MSTKQSEKTLVRISCADLDDAQELAAFLSAKGIEHGPISTIKPSPELALDFGTIVTHLHEIMLVIEALVITGTLGKWVIEKTDKAKKAPPPAQTSPGIKAAPLFVIQINTQSIVVNQNTDAKTLEAELEAAAQPKT